MNVLSNKRFFLLCGEYEIRVVWTNTPPILANYLKKHNQYYINILQ